MKNTAIVATTWLMTNNRLQKIGLGALVALSVLALAAPDGAALAGAASGGSR